jgi:hypothetical protein
LKRKFELTEKKFRDRTDFFSPLQFYYRVSVTSRRVASRRVVSRCSWKTKLFSKECDGGGRVTDSRQQKKLISKREKANKNSGAESMNFFRKSKLSFGRQFPRAIWPPGPMKAVKQKDIFLK